MDSPYSRPGRWGIDKPYDFFYFRFPNLSAIAVLPTRNQLLVGVTVALTGNPPGLFEGAAFFPEHCQALDTQAE